MSNLDSVLKSRDITLPTKVYIVKVMVFLVVMKGCESWIIKKAECQRIDVFELWRWTRLLRVPWASVRSNQSILKEISLGISLEEMMLKLKLQYFGHLMRRVDSLEKTLMLGSIGGRRRRGRHRGWDGWMASLTRWTWVRVNSGCSWWTGRPGMLQFMGSQRVGHNWVTELTDWTDWSHRILSTMPLVLRSLLDPTFLILCYSPYPTVCPWTWSVFFISCFHILRLQQISLHWSVIAPLGDQFSPFAQYFPCF